MGAPKQGATEKHRVLKQAVTKAFSLNRPLTEEEIGAIIGNL